MDESRAREVRLGGGNVGRVAWCAGSVVGLGEVAVDGPVSALDGAVGL